MGKKINSGTLRLLFYRAKNDLTLIIGIGIYLKVDAFDWWQIPAAIIFLVVRAYLDHKKVIRQEQTYGHNLDPMWMEMYNKIKSL